MTVLFENGKVIVKQGTIAPNIVTGGTYTIPEDITFEKAEQREDGVITITQWSPSSLSDGVTVMSETIFDATQPIYIGIASVGEIVGLMGATLDLYQTMGIGDPMAYGLMYDETLPTGMKLSEDAWGFDDEPTTQTIAEIEYPDGTVYEIEDTNARAKLDEKQDIITSANAGENIIITAGAVVPIVPLPEGYTQLEYIESTGSQYITLESTTYNQNDIVEIDYTYTSFAGSYPTIFGSGLSEIYANSNGDILVFRSIRVLEPTKYQINRKQTTIASFTASITSNQCISAYYTSGGATYFAMGKIYGFRHKRDNTVLKNLIPAREISTNNIGMYDIVNNTFINGSGIKQFIAGPIVADILKISADLSSKQDTLVSGTNIKTLNNQSLLGSGNINIKTAPDLDNKTISLNSDSQLQSVGSILQSGGYQKYWQGTKAEYEAIQVKDPDTLYEVLDDIVDIVTEIPTATVDDIGLVKPDGTTITVDDTGTLSVPSSFLLNHNSSNLAHVDVFNTKANVNLNNVSSRYDWITTRVIYNDGESGYELSRQGWIRQWGKVTSSANGEVEFTLHQPYINSNFSIFAQVNELGNYFLSIYPSGNQKFKLRVQSSNGTNMAVRVAWQSYGRYS